MGRRKKFSDDDLLKIVKEYLVTTAGSPSFLQIADWAQSHGYDIKEQNLRRCELVRKFLKEEVNHPTYSSKRILSAYVPFSVRENASRITTEHGMEAFLNKLEEREVYFKDIYNTNCSLFAELNDTQKVVQQQEQKTLECKKLIESLRFELDELKSTNRALLQQIRRYRVILSHFVTDTELLLLQESGINAKPETLNAEDITDYVEPDIPKNNNTLFAAASTFANEPYKEFNCDEEIENLLKEVRKRYE